MHAKRSLSLVIVAAAGCVTLGACGSSSLSRLLFDSDGQGPNTATDVVSPSPWSIVYHYDCRSQRSQGLQSAGSFTLTVKNSDDLTLVADNPITVRNGVQGNGTLHFSHPGDFEVAVNTVCSWRVTASKST